MKNSKMLRKRPHPRKIIRILFEIILNLKSKYKEINRMIDIKVKFIIENNNIMKLIIPLPNFYKFF